MLKITKIRPNIKIIIPKKIVKMILEDHTQKITINLIIIKKIDLIQEKKIMKEII